MAIANYNSKDLKSKYMEFIKIVNLHLEDFIHKNFLINLVFIACQMRIGVLPDLFSNTPR